MDAQRLEYLDRLGIPVWVPRAGNDAETTVEPTEPSATHDRLVMGPGEGAQLWLCAGEDVPATRLAADLARCLHEAPVWAWPGDAEGAVSLEAAVDARLFTAIVVLGEAPAGVGERIGSARVVTLPSLAALQRDAGARREAWRTLAANGLAGTA